MAHSSDIAPRSRLGLLVCSVLAGIAFVPLLVVGFFLTFIPESRSELLRFFWSLRDGLYSLLSGRFVGSVPAFLRSLILYHPDSKPPSDGRPAA